MAKLISGTSVYGNISIATFVSAVGNVTGNYFLGNGSLLTGVSTSASNINSGNSNVTVTASNANISVGVTGVSNVAVFASTGEYITGLLSASGNILGNNVVFAGPNASVGTATTAATYNIGTGATATGLTKAINIGTAGLAGSTTTIAIGPVTATTAAATATFNTATTVAMANTSATALSVAGNVRGGNLVSAGQITVTGNATGGNINTAGQVTATGNITAAAFLSTNNNSGFNYKIGDDVWIGDRNITNGFAITGINSSTAGYIQFGNDTALLGRTSTGALTWTAAFSVTANVTGGNILTAGLVSATGNVTGGNIRTAGLISATGNVTGNFFVGNGSALTGIGGGTSISSGNSNVAVVAANSNVSVGVGGTSNIAVFATTGEYVTGLLSVSGNILGGNITTGAGSGGNITGANVISCTNIKTTANTVANLPAAATVGAGARAFVTDATSVTFAATAVGGAANAVPVWTDGTTWKIG